MALNPISHPPDTNWLIAALPGEVQDGLSDRLEFVRCRQGTQLWEAGGKVEYAHFPVTGIVSLLFVTRSGDTAQLALIGREGMAGVSVFLGHGSPTNDAVVQCECYCWRLPAKALRQLFAKYPPLQLVLLKYTQSLITQISQTAVCNQHHSVDEHFCRWLLLSMDRLEGNELHMTQEVIAHMLGVRRQGVNEAAAKLEAAGAIRYRRGLITVLDRLALERRCCECYEVVRDEFDRLLTHTVVG